MNKIEIINSEGELKSFPIDQSIFLKSTNKIEDSFIKTNIVLIRNIKEHGLLNNSDLYNQNIGYVKNEFDLVPLEITEEQLGDYWKITCNPVYPLAPASSYTLFIDRRLSEEYADLKKVPEKSKGPSNLILKNINLTNSKDEGIYKFKDAVLHLDARRTKRSGRHGAEDRQLGLPDAPPGRRDAGPGGDGDRLRHRRRLADARHRRRRRGDRVAARAHPGPLGGRGRDQPRNARSGGSGRPDAGRRRD